MLKLRKAIKAAKEKGRLIGIKETIKQYSATIEKIKSDHARQLRSLMAAHKRELKLVERKNNQSIARRNRATTRAEKLNDEMEIYKTEIRSKAAEIREILASAKKRHYQRNRDFASINDSENELRWAERESFQAIKQADRLQ